MIQCKYYKIKIIICRNMSFVIALWVDIFIAYITLKTISAFLCHFYSGDLANIPGRTIFLHFFVALIIRWFGQFAPLPRCTWRLKAVPLPLASLIFWHLRFLGKLFSGVSSKFLHDSMGIAGCPPVQYIVLIVFNILCDILRSI